VQTDLMNPLYILHIFHHCSR